MARPLRIEFPGAVYHVTSRGNAQEKIFHEEKDFLAFLDVLCSVVRRFHWILHAYCLMTNHYHLLLETPDGNLAKGMRQLNGVYTQRFNRNHHRVGHIFQGRYKAILVQKDAHLLELCRYIVLNPVRAGMVKTPSAWPWSSYQATVGLKGGIRCLTPDWILLQFSKDRSQAEKSYREFVQSGLKATSPWKNVRGQIFLGDENFRQTMSKRIQGKETIKEIPKSQRYLARPSLEVLFQHESNKKRREKAIYDAHIRFGYTLKAIAEHLGMHYSSVSRVIKKVEQEKVTTMRV